SHRRLYGLRSAAAGVSSRGFISVPAEAIELGIDSVLASGRRRRLFPGAHIPDGHHAADYFAADRARTLRLRNHVVSLSNGAFERSRRIHQHCLSLLLFPEIPP